MTEAKVQGPLASLEPAERDLLLAAGNTCDVPLGEVLFEKGQPGESMYLIEDGSVELLFDEEKNAKVLGRGELLGEIALLAPDSKRTATARAATDCTLRVIDQASLGRLKDEHPRVLCSVLQHTCAYLVGSEISLIGDLKRRNAELERALDYLRRTKEELDAKDVLAHTDELTGLYNRRCLNTQLPKFVSRSEETGSGLAVLFLDLDKFKPINDTHGHAAGDLVLKAVGGLLRTGVRATDLPCRLGGDEFAVVLVDLDETEAEARAEALYEAIGELRVEAPEATLSVGASMGGTMRQAKDDGDSMLSRADEELYRAKGLGRDRLCWMGRVYQRTAARGD